MTGAVILTYGLRETRSVTATHDVVLDRSNAHLDCARWGRDADTPATVPATTIVAVADLPVRVKLR